MIAAIELPTPRILKKKFKKFITRERVGMYILILGGIGIIYWNSMPFKIITISTLIYCGVAYEVLENSNFIIDDPKLIEVILENHNSLGYFLY